MDTSRFDRWVQSVTGSASPRRTIFTLILGGATLSTGVAGTQAKKKRRRKRKCKGGQTKCGKRCVDLTSDARHCGSCATACASGELCLASQCVVGLADCPADADSCSATNTVDCTDNPVCGCFQRLEGEVRCVEFIVGGACDQCETDADCAELGFPLGSSCIRDDGPTCTCEANARGHCAAPCGFVASSARATRA